MTTQPKLWSERDFDECCYVVSGLSNLSMVCATPCRGSYCVTHRRQMDVALGLKPKRVRRPKPVRVARAQRVFVPVHVFQSAAANRIIEKVAKRYGVTGVFLKAARASKTFAPARREAVFELRNQGRPWMQVAAAMGLTDHTSAMQAYRKHVASLAVQSAREAA
jgi:hypothetical protein